jgi:hypothetical protein
MEQALRWENMIVARILTLLALTLYWAAFILHVAWAKRGCDVSQDALAAVSAQLPGYVRCVPPQLFANSKGAHHATALLD